MEEENILDSPLEELEEPNFSDFVEWWEMKCIYYNVILISVELLMLLYHYDAFLRFGLKDALIQCFLYTVVANFCYSIVLVLEVLLFFVFKIYQLNVRRFFYLLGLMFSVIYTVYIYNMELQHY